MHDWPLSVPPALDTWLREYSSKTIAVSGAGGFLGGTLVNRLATVPCHVMRVPRDPDWEPIVSAVDVVFHFAAQTSSAVAAADPNRDFAANVAPLRGLLAACRRLRRRPVILFAGTVTQAGIPVRLPVDENAVDRPVTIYDHHKLIAENDLKAAACDGTVKGATLRLANVYGPGARASGKDRNILNRMIAAAVRGEPLTVYGTGEHLRDYVFVNDVVDAFLMAGAQPDQVNAKHFVVGSGRGVTIREAFELVASRVEALTGRRVPVITAVPAAALSAIEQRDFIADSSRLTSATGWHPKWSLYDGIDRTIEAGPCE